MKPKCTLTSFYILIFCFYFLSSSQAGSILLKWQPNTDADLKGYNLYLGQASRAYGPPIEVGKVTDYTLDDLEDDTVYYLALTAVDHTSNESGFSSEIEIKTNPGQSVPPPDITPPLVNILTPTTMNSFETDQPIVTIAGEASDDIDIASITWESDQGTGGQAAGSPNWSITDIALIPGDNIINITAIDTAGNQGTDSLAVYYDPHQDLVSAVTVVSGKTYEIKNNLAGGNRAYIDRRHTYKNLPAQLDGITYIMTANKDKKSSGDSFLNFQVSKRVTVYVAHDDRIDNKPTWLTTFDNTGLKLSTDVAMSVYAKVYDAGPVALGGNGGGRRTSMYTVAISE